MVLTSVYLLWENLSLRTCVISNKNNMGEERNQTAGNNLDRENELELDYFKCDIEQGTHFTYGKAVNIFVTAVGAMIGLGIRQLS